MNDLVKSRKRMLALEDEIRKAAEQIHENGLVIGRALSQIRDERQREEQDRLREERLHPEFDTYLRDLTRDLERSLAELRKVTEEEWGLFAAKNPYTLQRWAEVAGEVAALAAAQAERTGLKEEHIRPTPPAATAQLTCRAGVKTARDDEAELRAVWSAIQDAYDAALEGDIKSAVGDLTFLYSETLDVEAQPSISRLWHLVADPLYWLIDEAVPELEGEIAPKIARHDKVTQAVAKRIHEIFGAMLAVFTDNCGEWPADWEEERGEDPSPPAADDGDDDLLQALEFLEFLQPRVRHLGLPDGQR
jgi:hypothetical protein